MERLEIRVVEIRGKCPVFRSGDKIVIDGPTINLKETDALCTHALASLLPYIVALRKGIKPKELGLGRGEKAYVQCLDPGPPYTDGGTVIFEITVVRDEAEKSLASCERGN
ncbi:TIGR04076 family protein [Thermococcus sp. GR7]|uniref:TIGR04076 family protein n=1 Tax=unclassified Thermococcus TaxID=2627626 RepID=UPI001430D632|nr:MULTISPECIES: TIGR04076 family protein [unclassified Thermococcus]NJE46107.1 TIGR04076 family protein [Thermococcus sp. GR7]NJE78257.1 TIGR04076 family protein [Thermococcus sp. GR4]NJF22304.1 TIGR04076 family protein [Thermococcus sp. GR5]